jgi:hypothetical protein
MKTDEVMKILGDCKITNVNPPSNIQNKLRSYIDLLNKMDDMMDRYTWLMDFGKREWYVFLLMFSVILKEAIYQPLKKKNYPA